jgi:hypothetical protein
MKKTYRKAVSLCLLLAVTFMIVGIAAAADPIEIRQPTTPPTIPPNTPIIATPVSEADLISLLNSLGIDPIEIRQPTTPPTIPPNTPIIATPVSEADLISLLNSL